MRRGLLQRRGEFDEEVRRLDAITIDYGNRLVHGHDFVELLCLAVRPFVNDKRLVLAQVCRRALAACLDVETLQGQEPFLSLARRAEAVSSERGSAFVDRSLSADFRQPPGQA